MNTYLHQLSSRQKFYISGSEVLYKPVSGLIRVSATNIVILVLNIETNQIQEMSANTLVTINE